MKNRRNSALEEHNDYLLTGEDEFEVFNKFLMKKVREISYFVYLMK